VLEYVQGLNKESGDDESDEQIEPDD